MDIETAKDIFKYFGHKVEPQSDLIDKHDFWYKGHYNMSTLEFMKACESHEVLTISEVNQLLEKFCVSVGKGGIEDNLHWQYYPHQQA